MRTIQGPIWMQTMHLPSLIERTTCFEPCEVSDGPTISVRVGRGSPTGCPAASPILWSQPRSGSSDRVRGSAGRQLAWPVLSGCSPPGATAWAAVVSRRAAAASSACLTNCAYCRLHRARPRARAPPSRSTRQSPGVGPLPMLFGLVLRQRARGGAACTAQQQRAIACRHLPHVVAVAIADLEGGDVGNELGRSSECRACLHSSVRWRFAKEAETERAACYAHARSKRWRRRRVLLPRAQQRGQEGERHGAQAAQNAVGGGRGQRAAQRAQATLCCLARLRDGARSPKFRSSYA
eukprot:6194545-Pleurochrysis_carterae.AAC.7